MDAALMNLDYKIHTDENYLIESIYNLIDSEDKLLVSLTESIETDTNISKYVPLIESVDNINDLSKDAKDIKDEKGAIKFLDKVTTSLKKLFDWWYKEDPDKKCQTLRIVLKSAMKLLSLILTLYVPSKVMAPKILNSGAGKAISKVAYSGGSKLLNRFFSKKAIATTIALVGFTEIETMIKSIDHSIYVRMNSKDLDANIKEYDITIDKLNNMLDDKNNEPVKKQLEAMKASTEKSLAALMKIKNERDKEFGEKEDKK